MNIRKIFTVLACCVTMIAVAQYKTEYEGVPFNGIVCDRAGVPIKKARIYVHDPKRYAISNKRGCFGLTDVAADDTLHVLVKKIRYDIPVNGKRSIRLLLADQYNYQAEEDQRLVDIGYGFVEYRENTGVSNGISGDELRRSGHTDILAALQGRIPGLYITNVRFGEAEVMIRGRNSINLSSTPLYVVDGIVVESLSMVNINDVDYVEVMKVATIYGSRGANGAIIVHTKR
ncbi:MAG: TonB-dependent receptor plug domain-containing protein [Prevotella sp.]|nr:TonB-dependent receptor plug domain-containing protein [Prevotella sp.]